MEAALNERGIFRIFANRKDTFQYTPLMEAVIHGNEDVVRFLSTQDLGGSDANC